MEEAAISLKPGRPKDPAKHDDIVAAASRLFMEKGYELTSMEAVARLAGVSKLTVYSHFKDKNDLFRAIIRTRCDTIIMPSSFAGFSAVPPQEGLLRVATQLMGVIYSEESLRLKRTIMSEVKRHPEMADIFYDAGPRPVRAALADLLRAYAMQGQLIISDADIATEHFCSLIKGERYMSVLIMLEPSPQGDALKAQMQSAVTCFLNAYAPREGKSS
jgi:TetR/AcrR family transcriptional repressor of mexJK operon